MTAQKIIPLTPAQAELIAHLYYAGGYVRLTQDDRKNALRLVSKRLVTRKGDNLFKATAFGERVYTNDNYRLIRA